MTLASIIRFGGYSIGFRIFIILRTFGCGSGSCTFIRDNLVGLGSYESTLLDVFALTKLPERLGWEEADTWLPDREFDYPLTWLVLKSLDYERIAVFKVEGDPSWLRSSFKRSKNVIVNCLKWSLSYSNSVSVGWDDLYAVLFVFAIAILERRLMIAALTLKTFAFFRTISSINCFSAA